MSDTPETEMQDRFMSEILADFYTRVHDFDHLEDFSIVLTGDADGYFRASVIAGGESTMGRASGQTWFTAVEKAVGRALAQLEVIKERIAADTAD